MHHWFSQTGVLIASLQSAPVLGFGLPMIMTVVQHSLCVSIPFPFFDLKFKPLSANYCILTVASQPVQLTPFPHSFPPEYSKDKARCDLSLFNFLSKSSVAPKCLFNDSQISPWPIYLFNPVHCHSFTGAAHRAQHI